MPTFYYSPNQQPSSPPAYIQPAAATPAANKWYDSNRSWRDYCHQWENYLGVGKKPNQPTYSTVEIGWPLPSKPNQPTYSTVEIGWPLPSKPNQPTYSTVEIGWPLPSQPDNLPYDHAFPFGVDPNDPSKPYAPYGFYYDAQGKVTTVPAVGNQADQLQSELQQHPDETDPLSPLNPYNVNSPMDPSNMQQFFDATKPGSPWHQYERQPNKMAPWEKTSGQDENSQWAQWEQPPLPGYISYPDGTVAYKDTPKNFPWLHDQYGSHHYRNENSVFSSMNGFFGLTQPQPNITEKIYLDSPVAPAGWQDVGSVDSGINFQLTPTQSTWLQDQDVSHHYKNNNGNDVFSSGISFGLTQPQPQFR